MSPPGDLDEDGESVDPREAAYAAEVSRLAALGRARPQHDTARAKYRAAVLAARAARTGTMAPIAAAGQLATLDEAAATPVDARRAFAGLVAVALERAQLYGGALAEAYAESGVDALVQVISTVDPQTGELVPNREAPTALVELEHRERKTAQELLVAAARLGLAERDVAAKEATAALLVNAARKFAERRGMDWSDPLVRRDVQAALLEAKAEQDRSGRLAPTSGHG